MIAVRHPPGRAGRLWLRRRLATAELGRDQLGHKLRVLLHEHERLQQLCREAEQTWVDAVAQARTWQLRAGVLGGQQAYAGGALPPPVQIQLHWTSVVGVTIPGDPRPVGPATAPPEVAGNAAVVVTAAAFDTALRAGTAVAAAEEAARRIEVEMALTRRRVRALERHWLPALRAALASVDQLLEFDEQEDGGRLRRALAKVTDTEQQRSRPPPVNVAHVGAADDGGVHAEPR
jgi:V/A-type H+-transporting ATPase subunit D